MSNSAEGQKRKRGSILTISCRGVPLQCDINCLARLPALYAKANGGFADAAGSDMHIAVDEDPVVFECVLDYARTGQLPTNAGCRSSKLAVALRFWKGQGMNDVRAAAAALRRPERSQIEYDTRLFLERLSNSDKAGIPAWRVVLPCEEYLEGDRWSRDAFKYFEAFPDVLREQALTAFDMEIVSVDIGVQAVGDNEEGRYLASSGDYVLTYCWWGHQNDALPGAMEYSPPAGFSPRTMSTIVYRDGDDIACINVDGVEVQFTFDSDADTIECKVLNAEAQKLRPLTVAVSSGEHAVEAIAQGGHVEADADDGYVYSGEAWDVDASDQRCGISVTSRPMFSKQQLTPSVTGLNKACGMRTVAATIRYV